MFLCYHVLFTFILSLQYADDRFFDRQIVVNLSTVQFNHLSKYPGQRSLRSDTHTHTH